MTRKQFGRYKIKSELGRGGMATVYHAYDPHFKRDVALKVLPREFLHDPNFITRFRREAQTIASLEHPAIVPVYDFGEEEKQPYLVMRYLAGGSLLYRLQKGGMALDAITRILTHLAPAIDEAHQQGIIHRDLKPANILFDHRNSPYKVDCVRCHTQNPVDATHCVNCGANLKAAQSRREELLEARRRQRTEREQAFAEKETRQRREKVARLPTELDNPNQQNMAIYQLNQIGSEALTGLIKTAVSQNRSARARASAAKLAGQICDEQEVKGLLKARVAKGLIKALDDSEPTVRYWAAEALGKFSGQPGQLAVESLGRLLKDRNEEVRQQARKSLQQIGGLRAQELLDQSKGFMGWLKGG